MEIILVRHGKPDCALGWLKPVHGAERALQTYFDSRVTIGVPQSLQGLDSSSTVCITSKLARSIDSAHILGFTGTIESELFNESELPSPDRLLIPLPWTVFLMVYPGKRKDRKRAREAAQHLVKLANNNKSVLLVGHGIMNRLICTELSKLGWQLIQKKGASYWSSLVLTNTEADR